jgi:hypothetical protein
MDKNTKELKYLEKIENDINEKLYDLLIMHLVDHHKKVRKSGSNKEKFISLLEIAINNIRDEMDSYKSSNFRLYRYILIYCNAILMYDTKRQDLKDLKKELIEDFTHSEQASGEKIPLNYQINEVRITYDTRYLFYLINYFINSKIWEKALYCLITVKLIEPDKEELEEFYKVIKQNLKDETLEFKEFNNPKDKILALDANVVISRIIYDVEDYRVGSKTTFDLEKLGNYNKFIITPSVINEVKEHLDFQLALTRRFCNKNPRFNYDDIESTLEKRFKKIVEKYKSEVIELKEENLEAIKKFYMKHLNKLEEIILAKLMGETVSHKLRKLAQRESMLPEEGDLKLLAEVIEINKTSDKEVAILTGDKDFTEFASGIKKEFGIEVYR